MEIQESKLDFAKRALIYQLGKIHRDTCNIILTYRHARNRESCASKIIPVNDHFWKDAKGKFLTKSEIAYKLLDIKNDESAVRIEIK